MGPSFPLYQTSFLGAPWHCVVQYESEASTHKHLCSQQHSQNLVHFRNACADGARIGLQVIWQREPEEHGKSEHEEVAGGVHVHKLQVGQSHSGNHAEEGAEHSPQDGVRERSKEGREFANGAQDQHDARTVLYHAPAAHLGYSQDANVGAGRGGPVAGTQKSCDNAANAFDKDAPVRKGSVGLV